MVRESKNRKESRLELLLYALLLSVAFAYPVLQMVVKALEGNSFEWNPILHAWVELLPFIVLLSVHVFLLLPILVDKGRTQSYVLLSVALVTAFYFYTYSQHQSQKYYKSAPLHQTVPPPFHHPEGRDPSKNEWNREKNQPFNPPKRPLPGIFPAPVFIDTLIAILLLVCSLAIRLIFRYYKNIQRMGELERSQMRRELEQLKAQISPHFFMNSLNNIHGMVEINPQKAQDMILELSGMMRHVLYESASPLIALSKEIDFLKNYIALMRERYTKDRVAIKYHFPDEKLTSLIHIPPLIFIVFVENAFKHGVNYQNDSFVHIDIAIDGSELTFCCLNSNPSTGKVEGVGGLGLDNIRRRLDMLYADKYTLDIKKQIDYFNVRLIIPTKNENQVFSNR